jgi:hypothetical protein
MKNKELYNYIREEIINTLNEDQAADKAAQDAEKMAIDKKVIALNKKKSELSKPESSLAEIDINNPSIKIFDVEIEDDDMVLVDYDGIEEKDVQRHGFITKDSLEIQFDEGPNEYLDEEIFAKKDLINLLKSKKVPYKERNPPDNFTYIVVSKRYINIEDNNISEMARTPNNVKVGDLAKMAVAKKLYSGTWKGDMLDAVEKAGEAGISQMGLAKAVGKTSQPAINPSVNEFLKIGAFILSKGATTPEIEPIVPKDEDEEEIEVKDDWEKPEEEEEQPDEPKVADIKAADKEASKISGGKGYAKTLSPEDEEKYSKIRKGIEAKMTKILALPKTKRSGSDDMKVLRQLITRDDIKKLFKDKGVSLKDLVVNVMSS